MINQIKDYFNIHYPSKFAITTGVICTAAALEMALHVPYDISRINSAVGGVLDTYKYNLSANLGGALFYGLCTFNIVPKTAAIGAGIFSLYSLLDSHNQEAFLTSRLLGRTIKFISIDLIGKSLEFIWVDILGKTAKFIANEIIYPIGKEILAPIIERIVDVVLLIINNIGKLIVKAPLPKHPIWIGVVVLGGTIVIYKLMQRYLFVPQQKVENLVLDEAI